MEYAVRAADYGLQQLTDREERNRLEKQAEGRTTPSYTELYRIIRNAMTSHQDWEHLVEGTPLENDLPVRATVAAYERYSK